MIEFAVMRKRFKPTPPHILEAHCRHVLNYLRLNRHPLATSMKELADHFDRANIPLVLATLIQRGQVEEVTGDWKHFGYAAVDSNP